MYKIDTKLSILCKKKILQNLHPIISIYQLYANNVLATEIIPIAAVLEAIHKSSDHYTNSNNGPFNSF